MKVERNPAFFSYNPVNISFKKGINGIELLEYDFAKFPKILHIKEQLHLDHP